MDPNQLWEPGEYQAIPQAIVYDESSGGTPCMTVTFLVNNTPKRVKLWLTPKAKLSTMKRLKDLGFNGSWEQPALTKNDPVTLTMRHGEYNGSWKEEWTYWGNGASVEKDMAKQFEAEYRSAGGVSKPAGRPANFNPTQAQTAPSQVNRPTPSRPSPPTTPNTGNQVVASNGDEAWDYWVNKHPQMPEQQRSEAWQKVVGDYKVPEDKLTPAQWNAIALAGDIPF